MIRFTETETVNLFDSNEVEALILELIYGQKADYTGEGDVEHENDDIE